ncbi:uncharacterized protein LOC106052188 [Biomphalaria glabrata]|uniref:Uncharacterized protein LOC106052188 n=1 Tax=Biomphalaria glabrata TaxID=6526 RepID=A0A9W2ZB95_BIOGL|nr:uncharacterized protein LOC106052188 [Biomphalaria glabrata]
MLRFVLIFVVLVTTQMVSEVESIIGGSLTRRFQTKDPDNIESHSNSMISKVSFQFNNTLSANKTVEDTELSGDSKYQEGGLDLEKKFKLKELPLDQFLPNTTEAYIPANKGVVGSEGQDVPNNKDKK